MNNLVNVQIFTSVLLPLGSLGSISLTSVLGTTFPIDPPIFSVVFTPIGLKVTTGDVSVSPYP